MLNMIIISWEYHKNMIRIDRNRSSYWIILIAHHSTKIYKRSWAHLHDNVILALQYPELVKGDARSLGDIVSLSLSPWTHKHCMVSIAWYLHLTMIQIAKRRLNKSKKKSVSWKKKLRHTAAPSHGQITGREVPSEREKRQHSFFALPISSGRICVN